VTVHGQVLRHDHRGREIGLKPSEHLSKREHTACGGNQGHDVVSQNLSRFDGLRSQLTSLGVNPKTSLGVAQPNVHTWSTSWVSNSSGQDRETGHIRIPGSGGGCASASAAARPGGPVEGGPFRRLSAGGPTRSPGSRATLFQRRIYRGLRGQLLMI
jgi:hypothetical protein